MVNIISKRDGPRREDVEIKRFIEQNREKITRIADHISDGAYSARKAPQKPVNEPKGLIIHTGITTRSTADVDLTIRISPNGRVVAMDGNTGRQLHHIGNIWSRGGVACFVLATEANRFFSPVDESIAAKLRDIDGIQIDHEHGEDQLVAEIERLLGID